MNTKHRMMLEQRAVNALQDLYHNATLPWGDFDDMPNELADWIGSDPHQILYDWINEHAHHEIEYLGSGGAYGADYAKTLRANFARKYPSGERAARSQYIRHGLRRMRLDREKFAPWENIQDFGNLYQWGRGGRTLAPENLIRQKGGSSFGINETITEDMNAEQLTQVCQIVESFNATVKGICACFPRLWREYLIDCQSQLADEQHSAQIAAARELESTRPDMYATA